MARKGYHPEGDKTMLSSAFFTQNRNELCALLPEGACALLFAGTAPRQSGDQYYPYYANRTFAYLTGLEKASAGFVLCLVKEKSGLESRLFILPGDAYAERWTGRRVKPAEAAALSGIEDIGYLSQLPGYLHSLYTSGRVSTVWLDLYRLTPEDPDTPAHAEAKRVASLYPQLTVCDLCAPVRQLRTIKKPEEIQAMRQAAEVTKAGILSMMQASRVGMHEYEYKALFDQALTSRGVTEPGFPSIIAVGDNNFCIHYYDTDGCTRDGDMVLVDVGARWNGLMNDVSRGFPCNGVFSERQRLLYQCAYQTSEHMFSLLAPGFPMEEVDRTIHAYCGRLLTEAGVLKSPSEERTVMWHGGAHHVGWDVHDIVDARGPVRPGMVFCVDVGIYVEEWGIGFRLEDNCLITETGCENLTRAIPRSIKEIEEAMRFHG